MSGTFVHLRRLFPLLSADVSLLAADFLSPFCNDSCGVVTPCQSSVSTRALHMQIAAVGLVYPSVLLIYFGEAAYLMHNTQDFAQSYFKVGARQSCLMMLHAGAQRFQIPKR